MKRMPKNHLCYVSQIKTRQLQKYSQKEMQNHQQMPTKSHLSNASQIQTIQLYRTRALRRKFKLDNCIETNMTAEGPLYEKKNVHTIEHDLTSNYH
jgi:hypothetical protein